MSRLEVIAGPMFSGKSEELIQRLRREQYGKKKILVVKPWVDRTTEPFIGARLIVDGKSVATAQLEAQIIRTVHDFRATVACHEFDTLGIDEAQFMGDWLPDLLKKLMVEREVRIIASGLDYDAWRRPFGPILSLMAIADEPQTLRAVCFTCGKPAMYTQKLGGTSQQVQPGDVGLYEARCWRCHTIPPEPKQ